MKIVAGLLATLTSLSLCAAEDGFTPLFNGTDLTGWNGNAALWSVQDGAITGITPPSESNPKNSILKHNTFLVYTNRTFGDFELRFSYKIVGGNSGVQYRSQVLAPGENGPIVGGYQADFEAGKTYSGILYEERGRGILAERGRATIVKTNPADANRPTVETVGGTGATEELQANIKAEDWNDYVVIARGHQLTHIINGRVTAMVSDEDVAKAAKSGSFALQIHAGPPMKVQFRNLRVREIAGGAATTAAAAAPLLDGDWKGTHLVFNGQPAGADFLAELEMNVTGKRFVVTTPERDMRGSMTFDAAAGTMDVEMDEGDVRKFYAIFELKGDTLKICYDASARPKEYSSEPDSQRILAIYKRVSK